MLHLRFGGVHGLVNNAGLGMQGFGNVIVGERKKFYEHDVDAWRRSMDVNFNGAFMMAKAMEEVGSVTDLKVIAAKIKSMKYDGVRLMRYDNDGRANSDIDIGILTDGKISSVRASPE